MTLKIVKSPKTDIAQDALIFRLPDELFLHIIFPCLSIDIRHVPLTCRKWNGIVKKMQTDNKTAQLFLNKFFPFLNIVAENSWEQHAHLEKLELSFKDAELLSIPKVADGLACFEDEIKGNGRLTLLMLPQGLSYKKLDAFAREPKEGNKTNLLITSPKQKEKVNNSASLSNTRIVIIKDSILEESKSTGFGYVVDQVINNGKLLLKKKNYQMAKPIEVMALAIMTFVSCHPDKIDSLFHVEMTPLILCEEEDALWSVMGFCRPNPKDKIAGEGGLQIGLRNKGNRCGGRAGVTPVKRLAPSSKKT